MKPIRMYLSKNISKEEFLDRFGPLVDENEWGHFAEAALRPGKLVYDYADLIEVSMDEDGTLRGIVVLLNGQFLRNYTGEQLDNFKRAYKARQDLPSEILR
tara:strand:- start:129 stop:431 length:303 start_codon:yes stop_codon:yes gene_type:complete